MDGLQAEELGAFVNAASFERGPLGGLVPYRLPPGVRAKIADPFLSFAAAEGSGTTLRFASQCAVVHLRVSTSALDIPMFPLAEPMLVVRSGVTEEVVSLDAGTIEFDPATGAVNVTSGPVHDVLLRRTPGEDVITVLLPHNARPEILGLDADQPLLPVSDNRPVWLHYGSSISHCADADTPATTWPMQVADGLGWNLRNLGLNGQAQLDQSVARFIRDFPADIITVKVGINIVVAGSMRQRVFRSAVHGFLDTIRDGHPHTPIVLISAIVCPDMEHAMGPGVIEDGRFVPFALDVDAGPDSLRLADSRSILRDIVFDRTATDGAIAYLDGLELFGASDAHLLPDGLHPNQEGMDLIARRFADRVPSLLRVRGWRPPISSVTESCPPDGDL